MARSAHQRLPFLFPFHTASPRIASDPAALRLWLREVILYWTRWGSVLLLILLLLFFPTRSRLLAVALLLIISAGNLALGWLLLRQFQPVRLRRVRLLATAFDWLVASVALLVFSLDLAEVAPAGALLVQMMSSIRYRLRGVTLAFVAATGLVGVWSSLHLLVFDVLDADRVPALVVGWTAALASFALLVGLVIVGGEALRGFEQALINAQIAVEERDRHGLSDRELELLPFLARHDLLTQNDIGQALDVKISGRTVGAHITHISEKMQVTRGRWAVVHAARQRGLLPPDDGSSGVVSET